MYRDRSVYMDIIYAPEIRFSARDFSHVCTSGILGGERLESYMCNSLRLVCL